MKLGNSLQGCVKQIWTYTAIEITPAIDYFQQIVKYDSCVIFLCIWSVIGETI